MKCISCKSETPQGVRITCPRCKKDIYRCNKCRQLSIEYKCECGFGGP